MTTSENSQGQEPGMTCTPRSFVKGLYLLAKSFVAEAAIPLGVIGLGVSLLGLLTTPAVYNYSLDVNAGAWASVVTFILGGACALLSYFKKPYRHQFLLAALFMVAAHLGLVMLTADAAPQHFYGDNWWRTAPLLLKAAVLPMYATGVLVQLALVGGAFAAVAWSLFKLPKAARAAGRYICRTGQGR